MIADVRFGRAKKWKKTVTFYVYFNASGTAFINYQYAGSWFGVEVDIVAILSHETLHKVIWKLEGDGASSGLDRWCRSRQWLYQDNTGLCFFASEMI